MPNTILTATAVTREALRVLHQKLNFVGTITRDYDESFARQGAKVGDTLKIRLPNQYTVRSTATLAVQDTTESSVDLKVATQKGVDLNFTSVDLTLNLDDFSERILEPAMSVLAANIEADAMNMYKDVWNQVGGATNFAKVMQARKALVDNLAPAAPCRRSPARRARPVTQRCFGPWANICRAASGTTRAGSAWAPASPSTSIARLSRRPTRLAADAGGEAKLARSPDLDYLRIWTRPEPWLRAPRLPPLRSASVHPGWMRRGSPPPTAGG
ncbi:MAG TPA: P22 phage major capsid protein family protein [Phenylobacterium sp.]|nr:P22 phage major capsid protein family protein [Phenylobacterium sp.]